MTQPLRVLAPNVKFETSSDDDTALKHAASKLLIKTETAAHERRVVDLSMLLSQLDDPYDAYELTCEQMGFRPLKDAPDDDG